MKSVAPRAERSPGPRSYVFQGREVTLPVEVRRASSATATYLVSARAARALLPDDRLEIAEIFPGTALFSLACVDYQDNDLGDYNEVSMAFFVRERGAPGALPYLGTLYNLVRYRLPTYIHRLPVDQSFTCEAGAGIWGFPKTVERIEMTLESGRGRFRCRLSSGGSHILSFSAPAGGTRSLPEAAMSTYSYIDGVLHKTAFRSAASGVGMRLGGASLELGDHPIADELRGLGLPKRALLSVWMESMSGTFEAPAPV